MKNKERLDELLVKVKLADSIDQAKKFIMAGIVIVNDHRIDKAGTQINTDSNIRIKDRIPYVSRGGLKLEKAVKSFSINFHDKIVMDVGASTGGFTDVALQNGAKKVYAIDVGKAQLHNNLLINSKVINLEKTNFRTIQYEKIGEKTDIIVSDVSFISLALIVPSFVQFCKDDTLIIILIKPQFEVEKDQVGKNGVVRDLTLHQHVINNLINMTESNKFGLCGLTASPIKGPKGNIEYLAHFKYNNQNLLTNDMINNIINKVVYENYCYNC